MKDANLWKVSFLEEKNQENLKQINSKFGNFFTRVADEAWGLPLIDQKTKALIAIAVDVINQNHVGSGNLFAAHLRIALQEGATRAEIEEVLLFLCVYAGFNKVAGCLGTLNEIFEQIGVRKMIATTKPNYASRDQQGKAVFYILLWKRKGINLDLFSDYWRNVHGPVCARLPGQHQYWQFHLEHNQDDLWPTIDGIDDNTPPEDQFDGIAELSFASEEERQTWFQAAGILMDDEHNVFSKAIGYNTKLGNSKTYVDRIETGTPNGDLGILKFHVMVKKADAVSVEAFRQYMSDSFASAIVESDSVLKFRLHLFEEVDNSRPDAAGVVHYEPPEKQYQAAFEIAFSNPLEMEKFFASKEYAAAVENQAKYVKQISPFAERRTYTFVQDGEMTIAGQRSSRVAELITEVGATNQLKENLVSLMSGSSHISDKEPNVNSGLGNYLKGVHHFGVTVNDMAKSLEFYTEILGGKLVVSENSLVGDTIQNTLFQEDELDATNQGIDPKTVGIPNLRDSSEALDIKFISFGNACVELLHFKDTASTSSSPQTAKSIPSHVGHVNAMHLSFHVREDVDLNIFAKLLEEECQRRGMTNVVFNRVIRVKSEGERKNIALKYNSNKFWYEQDSLAGNESEEEFGEFEGWALLYCKGPNGEQLEFNQATRKVKEHFEEAKEEYNMTKEKPVSSSNEKVKNQNLEQSVEMLERVYATFSSPVNASLETIWTVIKDKVENPSKYNPETQDYKILERHGNGVLRQMKVLNMAVKERVTWDEKTREIRHTLVNNPLFFGQAINAVVGSASNNSSELPILTYTVDWEPYNDEARKAAPEIQEKLTQAVQQAVLNSKTIAEQQETQKESPAKVETASIEEGTLMSERLPGTATDMVKRLFSRGEAFDPDGFITFFTDTPVYQFGNFEVCFDKAAIKKSAQAFFSAISAVYHDLKMMWEVGDVVFVEMDVTYWRKDGSVISLPCCDLFRVEGDKFSELRIFMDVNPVFDSTIAVPDSASVFTASEGKRLTPPDTMKKHYAEHPEGKTRVETGFAPKWSITGPKWSTDNEEVNMSEQQLLSEQSQTAQQLAESVLNEDWERVKTFLTEDVFYKVGSAEPVYGRQAVVDYLFSLFQNTAKFTGHEIRKIWQEPGIIVVEMDAKYTTVKDKRHLNIACCDVYRLRGNQVSEWRVYADILPFYETDPQQTLANEDGNRQLSGVR
jgi:alkylhydroperoxidase/carboxymuconolactone decarboxylase family protein YurZ/ketosteroid isomerase-like protein/catechol 2,3-dioxygenase-like lactoylglutathione lyase family enzyme